MKEVGVYPFGEDRIIKGNLLKRCLAVASGGVEYITQSRNIKG